MSRFLAAALLLGLLAGHAEARDVEVLVESRKGIGLIPSFWRGVVSGGTSPADFAPNWVRIDSRLVEAAWREKVGGGGPGWVALDAAIDAAVARGARAIVTIPVSAAPAREEDWRARVEDTVRRTHPRVDRYEFASDASIPPERFLNYYESGVWAAYQGYHRAVVGGPGVDLGQGLLEALTQRCRERDLPLHFVSWAVRVDTGAEAESTFRRVERLLDRAGLKTRPEAVVSTWTMAESADPAAATFAFLHSITKLNLHAAAADLTRLPWGEPALRTFDRLGQVEIPMLFEPEGDLGGVATLDGDDVRILLWAGRATRANIAVSGMRWGRTYDYVRSVVGARRTQVVDSRELRAEDPVKISVAVSPGSPVFLTLTPTQ